MHVDVILEQCSQRIYLLQRLHSQGLSLEQINVVFNAPVVLRIFNTLSACGANLTTAQIGRIYGFLKHTLRFK